MMVETISTLSPYETWMAFCSARGAILIIDLELPAPPRGQPLQAGEASGWVRGRRELTRQHQHLKTHLFFGAREGNTPRSLKEQYFVNIPTCCGYTGLSRGCVGGSVAPTGVHEAGARPAAKKPHGDRRPAAGVIRESASPNIYHT